MLAGLPQMCGAELATLERPLGLVLSRPGGGRWTIRPLTAGPGVEVVRDGEGQVAASVRSTAHDFVIWGTQRRDWREDVEIDGDRELAAAVLDRINVV